MEPVSDTTIWNFINDKGTTILVAGLIGILVGMFVMDLMQNTNNTTLVNGKPDTTYNRVKLDSIQVNIIKHDSTIYKLNIKLKDDVKKSYLLNDTASVNLFRKLVADK